MVQGANIYKKMELTLRSERKKQIYLHFSEPQGRKAHAVGLKQEAKKGKLRGFSYLCHEKREKQL